MKAIVGGKIVLPDGIVEGQVLVFSDKIEEIAPPKALAPAVETIDAKGGYILPGLIDLHIHGYAGVDATAATAEDLARMGNALLKTGVTGFLATTMTADARTLKAAWGACREAMASCQNLLGVNAEGPFVSTEKCGAQDPAFAIPPDPAMMTPYADVIRLATVAPELPGAIEAIRGLTAAGIQVAVGHTNADYDTVMAGIAAGAVHATHLFNAMSDLHHRAPGAVGAVLGSPVTCEWIADGHHLHPALYEPVWRIKGRDLCLITDCLAAGGLPAGEYPLGKAPIVSDGTLCRRKDGTLAGSAGTLINNLKNLYNATRIPLWECVNAASLNPAAVLGLSDRKGSLLPGKDADLVIVNEDFTVTATILGGDVVYS